VKRISSEACCGKKNIYIETDFPILKEYIDYFINNNYITNSSYIKSGFFYIENNGVIAICPFGSNKLQIKCKNSSCNEELDSIEKIFISNVQQYK